MKEFDFNALEKNLADIIAEQQIKLGYRKESVRLYYPKSSLINLLCKDVYDFRRETDRNAQEEKYRGGPGCNVCDVIGNQKLKDIINGYFDDNIKASPLSGLQISYKGDRFCITISPDGSEYVHNRLMSANIPEVEFLKDFLDCVSRHHISLADIKSIFGKYSDCVICEETDIPDFDYLIYFGDGKPDEYMYCIKFEGEHAIYHRFTKADYRDFNF